MKRWWLPVLLLLSVGFNVGLLVSMVLAPSQAAPSAAVGDEHEQPPDRQIPERRATGPRPDDRGSGSDRQNPPVLGEAPAQGLQGLADRLDLQGPSRQEFLGLQRRLQEDLRQRVPRLNRLRRELYREMASPVPDQQKLERATARMARLTVEIERHFVRTVIESRRLLDRRQEEVYLRFVATRFRFVREALTPGTGAARRGASRRQSVEREREIPRGRSAPWP